MTRVFNVLSRVLLVTIQGRILIIYFLIVLLLCRFGKGLVSGLPFNRPAIIPDQWQNAFLLFFNTIMLTTPSASLSLYGAFGSTGTLNYGKTLTNQQLK
jgi:hypothetical protein